MADIEDASAEMGSALSSLCQALSNWEKATGTRSVVVLRAQGGRTLRLLDGKAVNLKTISDEELFELVQPRGSSTGDRTGSQEGAE
ncbi:MAG: hypothetical protein HYT87_12820 [Nitrospirae bacterium]|nr:hypothetical protein [Nitrospirota bacterium]